MLDQHIYRAKQEAPSNAIYMGLAETIKNENMFI